MNIFVNEKSEVGLPPIDIYSKLAQDRIIFIGDIDDKEASDIGATLLLKDLEDPLREITLIINSMGGDIRNVFMIYDMMKTLSSPIKTVCVGDAAQEAVLLLASGTKGLRFATKNALICPSQLMHDKYFQVDLGDAKDLLARSNRDNKNFMGILAKQTGKKLSEVMKDFERQQYFDANQAKKYGLIDAVL